MKNFLVISLFLLLCPSYGRAQKYLKARIVDYVTNVDLVDSLVTVELLNTDSISLNTPAHVFSITENYKKRTSMWLWVPKEGEYIVRCSHPDYHTLYVPVKVKFYKREGDIDLGKFALKRKPRITTLGEAVVSASKLKFYFKNDTLVYNADAFITQQGFVLENILQKMPGITINADGEIFSNGRKIETLLLNGKDFFNSDRKTLLENLPAFMVKHVTVYNKKKNTTDLFERERELEGLVMNVKLKPEYHSAFISNIDVAAGTDHHFYGRGLGLKIHDLHRLSVYASGNNTNHNEELTRNGQFYNIDNGVGQKKFYNAGFHYNVDEREGRYALDGKTRFQWSKEYMTMEQNTQQFYDLQDIFNLNALSNNVRNFSFQSQHTFSLLANSLWAFSVKPSLVHIHSKNETEHLAAFFDQDVLSLLGVTWKDHLRQQELSETLKLYGINRSNLFALSPNKLTSGTLEFEKSIDIPHSMDRISFGLIGAYVHKDKETYTQQNIDYLRIPLEQWQHQYQHSWSDLWKWTANVSYLYKLNEHHSLTGKFSYERTNLSSNDYFYQLHQLPEWSQSENRFVGALPDKAQLKQAEDLGNSNSYKETEKDYTMELNYLFELKKYHLSINVPLRYQQHDLDFFQQNNNQTISRSLLRPDLNIRFYTWLHGHTGYNYSINYTLAHKMPQMNLLANQTNTVNPLLIIQGNPNLSNITEHKVNGTFYWAPAMRHNHMLMLDYSYYKGLTSLAMLYDQNTGGYVSVPKSVDGNQRCNVTLQNSVFLSPKFTHKMTNKFVFSYGKSADYNGLTDLEAERVSVVHNYTLSEELNYAFSTPNTKYRGEISPYINYHRSTSLRENFTPLNAVDFGLRLSLLCELPWSIRFQTDLRSVSRRGYYDDSINDDEIIWNASVTKSFTNHFSLTLEAIDFLGQRKNVVRFVNAQSRVETVYNNLRQYAMLHLIWQLNN